MKASLRSSRYLLCALFLCFSFLTFFFVSFTSGFIHQLQKGENTIFLVIENILQVCIFLPCRKTLSIKIVIKLGSFICSNMRAAGERKYAGAPVATVIEALIMTQRGKEMMLPAPAGRDSTAFHRQQEL
jgi:hypothetical protein